MKNAIKYLLIKIQLLLWLSRMITPDSEAVLAMTGGKWDGSMRKVALELLLSEARK